MVRANSGRYSCFLRCQRRVMSLAAGTALAVTVSAGRPELAHAEDAVVEIAEAVWTDNVTDADRTYATRFADSVLLRPPLYFWTRVNGRSEALAKLRSEGKLPIRHEWQQLLGPKWIWDNDGEPLDAIALSVGREEKLAQLQRELQNRHFFDWRTWSKKDNLTRGWWRVSVKYANGDDVMCAGDPCRYMIKVK